MNHNIITLTDHELAVVLAHLKCSAVPDEGLRVFRVIAGQTQSYGDLLRALEPEREEIR